MSRIKLAETNEMHRIVYPSMPFRLNILVVFTFALAAIVLLHLNDRRAGGE